MQIDEAISTVRKMEVIARGFQDMAAEFKQMADALETLCDEVTRLQHELLVAVSQL